MDPTTQKLQTCFLTVFPQLNAATVPGATAENVADWDSVKHITLLTLIGEEFAIDIDFEEFAGAASFQEVLNRLRALTS